MTDKLYQGMRVNGDAHVIVIDDKRRYPLPPRNDVMNHSPDGFEWGYGGSGPAQLALALCVDALGGNEPLSGACAATLNDPDWYCCGGPGTRCVCVLRGDHLWHLCANCAHKWQREDITKAQSVYQDFKFRHIANLSGPCTQNDNWTLTADQVRVWIKDIELEHSGRGVSVALGEQTR